MEPERRRAWEAARAEAREAAARRNWSAAIDAWQQAHDLVQHLALPHARAHVALAAASLRAGRARAGAANLWASLAGAAASAAGRIPARPVAAPPTDRAS